jgi:hypothetical protein
MDAKMSLQHLAAPADRTEPLVRRRAATIIPAQIGSRLFAFENRGHPRLFRLGPVGRYVGPVTALGQGDFRRACRIAVCLRPEKSEALEAKVHFRFATAVR